MAADKRREGSAGSSHEEEAGKKKKGRKAGGKMRAWSEDSGNGKAAKSAGEGAASDEDGAAAAKRKGRKKSKAKEKGGKKKDKKANKKDSDASGSDAGGGRGRSRSRGGRSRAKSNSGSAPRKKSEAKDDEDGGKKGGKASRSRSGSRKSEEKKKAKKAKKKKKKAARSPSRSGSRKSEDGKEAKKEKESGSAERSGSDESEEKAKKGKKEKKGGRKRKRRKRKGSGSASGDDADRGSRASAGGDGNDDDAKSKGSGDGGRGRHGRRRRRRRKRRSRRGSRSGSRRSGSRSRSRSRSRSGPWRGGRGGRSRGAGRSKDLRPMVERCKGGVKLFVGRLPEQASQASLRAAFEEYGEVLEVFLIDSTNTNKGARCAFVRLDSLENAERAIGEMHERRILVPERRELGPIQVAFAKGEALRFGLGVQREQLNHRPAPGPHVLGPGPAKGPLVFDPESLSKEMLVEFIKECQRGGGQPFKDQWWSYCDSGKGGVRDYDPHRHPAASLKQFFGTEQQVEWDNQPWFRRAIQRAMKGEGRRKRVRVRKRRRSRSSSSSSSSTSSSSGGNSSEKRKKKASAAVAAAVANMATSGVRPGGGTSPAAGRRPGAAGRPRNILALPQLAGFSPPPLPQLLALPAAPSAAQGGASSPPGAAPAAAAPGRFAAQPPPTGMSAGADPAPPPEAEAPQPPPPAPKKKLAPASEERDRALDAFLEKHGISPRTSFLMLKLTKDQAATIMSSVNERLRLAAERVLSGTGPIGPEKSAEEVVLSVLRNFGIQTSVASRGGTWTSLQRGSPSRAKTRPVAESLGAVFETAAGAGERPPPHAAALDIKLHGLGSLQSLDVESLLGPGFEGALPIVVDEGDEERPKRLSSAASDPEALGSKVLQFADTAVRVKNLAKNTGEGELRKLFEPHGAVKDVDVLCEKNSTLSRGVAIVVMSSREEVLRAIKALNFTKPFGRALVVEALRDEPEKEKKAPEEPANPTAARPKSSALPGSNKAAPPPDAGEARPAKPRSDASDAGSGAKARKRSARRRRSRSRSRRSRSRSSSSSSSSGTSSRSSKWSKYTVRPKDRRRKRSRRNKRSRSSSYDDESDSRDDAAPEAAQPLPMPGAMPPWGMPWGLPHPLAMFDDQGYLAYDAEEAERELLRAERRAKREARKQKEQPWEDHPARLKQRQRAKSSSDSASSSSSSSRSASRKRRRRRAEADGAGPGRPGMVPAMGGFPPPPPYGMPAWDGQHSAPPGAPRGMPRGMPHGMPPGMLGASPYGHLPPGFPTMPTMMGGPGPPGMMPPPWMQAQMGHMGQEDAAPTKQKLKAEDKGKKKQSKNKKKKNKKGIDSSSAGSDSSGSGSSSEESSCVVSDGEI